MTTRNLIERKKLDLSGVRRDMKGISPKVSTYARLAEQARGLEREIAALEKSEKEWKTAEKGVKGRISVDMRKMGAVKSPRTRAKAAA